MSIIYKLKGLIIEIIETQNIPTNLQNKRSAIKNRVTLLKEHTNDFKKLRADITELKSYSKKNYYILKDIKKIKEQKLRILKDIKNIKEQKLDMFKKIFDEEAKDRRRKLEVKEKMLELQLEEFKLRKSIGAMENEN